jgi:uncharacterized protein YicC (UPF0701 family)
MSSLDEIKKELAKISATFLQNENKRIKKVLRLYADAMTICDEQILVATKKNIPELIERAKITKGQVAEWFIQFGVGKRMEAIEHLREVNLIPQKLCPRRMPSCLYNPSHRCQGDPTQCQG